jgi:hypothetical protein
MLIVRQLITIVLISVAVGTPLVILVKSAVDFWRADAGRGAIFLKGVVALMVWLTVSLVLMFMLFATFYGSAHSEYRMSHGGAADPAGSDDPTGTIILLVAIYTLAGGGLSYWMLRGKNA